MVEDDEDLRKMVCALLASRGPATLPQAALVDIDLPDIPGHAVARALAPGFDRHLKKPLCLEDIERAIGERDRCAECAFLQQKNAPPAP